MQPDTDEIRETHRAPLRRRLLSAWAEIHPVWWLNLAICTAAALLATQVVSGYPAISAPHATWWLLAAVIAITERWPVNLQFQRSSHSFSLTDIPVTLGFIFASGGDLVLGGLLGTAVAMLLRRSPLIKSVFNLGQFLLAIAVGEVIVHAIAGPATVFEPQVWVGALVATQVGGVLTILLLAAVMSLADGQFSREELRRMFNMDLVVTAANTSLALIGAIVLVAAPAALPILLVPIVIGYGGYRTYVREHERHKKVEFLYQANRGLAESPEVAVAVEGLLERAREAFRAEQAEVILFAQEGKVPLR